jgi:rubrerythrin
MYEHSHRQKLTRILQNAYSGELAAALAYRGHWKSLDNPDEIEKIQQIETEEWIHREKVDCMLAILGAAPVKSKEMRMWLTGRVIGAACHIVGWFLPMYFAGRLEAANVDEYRTAARHAKEAGFVEFESELRVMALVEKQHEEFFSRMVAGHHLLPLAKGLFKWGPSDDQRGIEIKRDAPLSE